MKSSLFKIFSVPVSALMERVSERELCSSIQGLPCSFSYGGKSGLSPCLFQYPKHLPPLPPLRPASPSYTDISHLFHLTEQSLLFGRFGGHGSTLRLSKLRRDWINLTNPTRNHFRTLTFFLFRFILCSFIQQILT